MCQRLSLKLMNGTSMASPHVAGAVSVLLSGMRARQLPFSPFSVKRALQNSALHLADVCDYGQGHGLLQIGGAFEHLVQNSDSVERDVRFAVTCNGNSKGIYMRKAAGTRDWEKTEVPVKVEPYFLNHESACVDSQIGFNLRLALVCSPPVTWVSSPTYLVGTLPSNIAISCLFRT